MFKSDVKEFFKFYRVNLVRKFGHDFKHRTKSFLFFFHKWRSFFSNGVKVTNQVVDTVKHLLLYQLICR